MIIPLTGSGMVQLTLIVSDERDTAVTPVGGDGAEEREHIVEVIESQNNPWRIISTLSVKKHMRYVHV